MKTKTLLASLALTVTFTVDSYAEGWVVDVTEQTIKIGGLGEEVLRFGFAKNDQIVFNFTEVDGKELKEVEILEYPSTSKFMDYKTKEIKNKIINVGQQAVFVFRFSNSAISGRICKIKIQRIPDSDKTQNFNTAVKQITKTDTTWDTYTKDVLLRYDTKEVQKSRRVLISTDTSVVQLFDKTEHIYSKLNKYGKPYNSYINVNLPQNTYTPNKFIPYTATEVVAWSYWLGVGQKAKEDYDKVNSGFKEGIAAIGALTGYGALASLAITGISMFGTTATGNHIQYSFRQNNISFDQGDVVSASGRNNTVSQGGFSIELTNNNYTTGLEVSIKVIAVTITKKWQDQSYTDTKSTPIYEKQILKDPIIKSTKLWVTIDK